MIRNGMQLQDIHATVILVINQLNAQNLVL